MILIFLAFFYFFLLHGSGLVFLRASGGHNGESVHCAFCGDMLSIDLLLFCRSCGAIICSKCLKRESSKALFCSYCSALIPEEVIFCSVCGRRSEKKEGNTTIRMCPSCLSRDIHPVDEERKFLVFSFRDLVLKLRHEFTNIADFVSVFNSVLNRAILLRRNNFLHYPIIEQSLNEIRNGFPTCLKEVEQAITHTAKSLAQHVLSFSRPNQMSPLDLKSNFIVLKTLSEEVEVFENLVSQRLGFFSERSKQAERSVERLEEIKSVFDKLSSFIEIMPGESAVCIYRYKKFASAPRKINLKKGRGYIILTNHRILFLPLKDIKHDNEEKKQTKSLNFYELKLENTHMIDIENHFFSGKKVIFRTDEGEYLFLFSRREAAKLKDVFKFSKKYYENAVKNSYFLEQLARDKIDIEPFKKRVEKLIDNILFPLGLSQKQLVGGIKDEYYPFDFLNFLDSPNLESNYHAIIKILNKLDEKFQKGEINGPEYRRYIGYYINLLESNHYAIIKVLNTLHERFERGEINGPDYIRQIKHYNQQKFMIRKELDRRKNRFDSPII